MGDNTLALFAGAGGDVEGFKQAGYNVIAAVDFDEDCIATIEANHDDVQAIQEDLSEVGPAEFAEKYDIQASDVDVMTGGPPCQGFSIAGKRDPDDERNTLVQDFLDYVDHYEPRAVVMENVVGILSMESGDVKHYVVDRLETMGYDASVDVHDASDHGVPQKRERAIFIGLRGGGDASPALQSRTTVADAIGDYPSLQSGECADGVPNHSAPSHGGDMVNRLRELSSGESLHGGQAYRRLYADREAHTMTHNNNAPAVHYDQPRVITVREMAALQSFPDDYTFCGTKREQYIQVGNAAPVQLMQSIAQAMKQ